MTRKRIGGWSAPIVRRGTKNSRPWEWTEPMKMNRRELLASAPRLEGAEPNGSRMGVVIHSYAIRQAADKEKTDRFDDPLTFLEYCRTLGAGGVQIALGARDETYSAKMRRHLAGDDAHGEHAGQPERRGRDRGEDAPPGYHGERRQGKEVCEPPTHYR